MKLTRRQFAIGFGTLASCAVTDLRFGLGEPAPFSTRLPIPAFIDAAKQGNAVDLRVRTGWHAFFKGKPTRTYGYSALILGPVGKVSTVSRFFTCTADAPADKLGASGHRELHGALHRFGALGQLTRAAAFIHPCEPTSPNNRFSMAAFCQARMAFGAVLPIVLSGWPRNSPTAIQRLSAY
jgi:hypothetical protein